MNTDAANAPSGIARTHQGPATVASSDILTLQIGERRFTTNRDTLTDESDYFAICFEWENHKQPDGTVFIDRDGDIFEHVLRYLRTGLLPIFHDHGLGYDHIMYQRLLREAQYFQVAKLEEYVESRRYTKAVTINRSAQILSATDEVQGSHEPDVKIEYHPTWQMEKVYICPRGIFVHRGDRARCGRQCENARGDAEVEFEEETVLQILEIRTELSFNKDVIAS